MAADPKFKDFLGEVAVAVAEAQTRLDGLVSTQSRYYISRADVECRTTFRWEGGEETGRLRAFFGRKDASEEWSRESLSVIRLEIVSLPTDSQDGDGPHA